MSVKVISGKTGAGKSLKAVELIIGLLKQGRTVVTNIPMTVDLDNLHVWDWEHLDNSNIPEQEYQERYPKGSVYFIDECVRHLKAGEAVTKVTNRKMTFFTEHRHRKNAENFTDDIFLLVQSASQLPKWIRDLVEQTTICVKPTDWGVKSVSIRHTFEGCICSTEITKSIEKFRISSETVQIKPEIYQYYQSHTQGDDGAVGSEVVESVGTNTIFQSMRFKFYVFMLISAIGLMVWGVSHTNKAKDKYINNDLSNKVIPSASASTLPPVQQPTQPPVQQLTMQQQTQKRNEEEQKKSSEYESTKWRVSGVLESKKGKRLYLSDVAGHIRSIPLDKCKSDDFEQYTCKDDKEIITTYTGKYSMETSLSGGVAMATDKTIGAK
jgi:zona occludens toxin (predicted ATPase)